MVRYKEAINKMYNESVDINLKPLLNFKGKIVGSQEEGYETIKEFQELLSSSTTFSLEKKDEIKLKLKTIQEYAEVIEKGK